MLPRESHIHGISDRVLCLPTLDCRPCCVADPIRLLNRVYLMSASELVIGGVDFDI